MRELRNEATENSLEIKYQRFRLHNSEAKSKYRFSVSNSKNEKVEIIIVSILR